MGLVQGLKPRDDLIHRADQRFLVYMAVQRLDAAVHPQQRRIVGDPREGVRLNGHGLVVEFIAGIGSARHAEGHVPALCGKVGLPLQITDRLRAAPVIQVTEGHSLLMEIWGGVGNGGQVVVPENTAHGVPMLLCGKDRQLRIAVEIHLRDLPQNVDQAFFIVQEGHEYFEDVRRGIELLRHVYVLLSFYTFWQSMMILQRLVPSIII